MRVSGVDFTRREKTRVAGHSTLKQQMSLCFDSHSRRLENTLKRALKRQAVKFYKCLFNILIDPLRE